MAGERCSEKFWELALSDNQKDSGRYCREGLKRGDTHRDWVDVDDEGNVHRGVWNCSIAKYDKGSDTVILNDCGWETLLTKKRMNQILDDLDFYISQKDYVWYITKPHPYGRIERNKSKEVNFPTKIDDVKKRIEFSNNNKPYPEKSDKIMDW